MKHGMMEMSAPCTDNIRCRFGKCCIARHVRVSALFFPVSMAMILKKGLTILMNGLRHHARCCFVTGQSKLLCGGFGIVQ